MTENGDKAPGVGLPRDEMAKRLQEAGLGPKPNGKTKAQPASLTLEVYKAAFGQQAVWVDVRSSRDEVIEIVVAGGDLARIRLALEPLMPADKLWVVRRLEGRQLRRYNWLMRATQLFGTVQRSIRGRMEQFGGRFRGV